MTTKFEGRVHHRSFWYSKNNLLHLLHILHFDVANTAWKCTNLLTISLFNNVLILIDQSTDTIRQPKRVCRNVSQAMKMNFSQYLKLSHDDKLCDTHYKQLHYLLQQNDKGNLIAFIMF